MSSTLLPLPVNISKYVTYRNTSKGHPTLLTGLELTKGKLHRCVGLNEFEATPISIPKGFVKQPKKRKSSWFKRWTYDPTRKRLIKSDPQVKSMLAKHKGWKTYFTTSNRGRLYAVYVSKDDARVAVYTLPTESGQPFISESDVSGTPARWHYCIPVASFANVVKVWVGKSPKTGMTEFSGGFGPKFTGNTVLVQLSPQKYLFVGRSVYTFRNRSPIVEYWSPVGSNDVPYPVAFSSTKAFFMLDREWIATVDFTNLPTASQKKDLYYFYYSHDANEGWGTKRAGKSTTPLIPESATRHQFSDVKVLHTE